MLTFSSIYIIIQYFTILNVKCSCVWVITVPTVNKYVCTYVCVCVCVYTFL
jgi:hypothetical protein